jgi:hypothetical protein
MYNVVCRSMTIEARYAASDSGSSRIENQAMYSAVIWGSLRRQKPLGIRHQAKQPKSLFPTFQERPKIMSSVDNIGQFEMYVGGSRSPRRKPTLSERVARSITWGMGLTGNRTHDLWSFKCAVMINTHLNLLRMWICRLFADLIPTPWIGSPRTS